jgi:hypothetical protein
MALWPDAKRSLPLATTAAAEAVTSTAAATTSAAAATTVAAAATTAATTVAAATTTAAVASATAAVIAAAATTTAATTAAATVAAATAAASTTTATASAGRFRLGNVHGQRATVKVLVVQALNGGLSLVIARHFDKGEPATATGVAVIHHFGALNRSVAPEHLFQIGHVRLKRQIADIQLLPHSFVS